MTRPASIVSLVCRYPLTSRNSHRPFCVGPPEPLGVNLEGKLEAVARSNAVLEPQEVPPLVAHLHKTGTRLRCSGDSRPIGLIIITVVDDGQII